MLYLFFCVIFFIFIFNVLLPLLINRIKIQKQIIAANPDLTKITCNNGHLFLVNPSITGLDINYFVDDKGEPVPCSQTVTDKQPTRLCGMRGEYNNRYNPCFVYLSELLFYRTNRA